MDSVVFHSTKHTKRCQRSKKKSLSLFAFAWCEWSITLQNFRKINIVSTCEYSFCTRVNEIMYIKTFIAVKVAGVVYVKLLQAISQLVAISLVVKKCKCSKTLRYCNRLEWSLDRTKVNSALATTVTPMSRHRNPI